MTPNLPQKKIQLHTSQITTKPVHLHRNLLTGDNTPRRLYSYTSVWAFRFAIANISGISFGCLINPSRRSDGFMSHRSLRSPYTAV